MKGQLEIPQTSEELEELLHDDGRMNDILKNGQFGELTAGYIAKAMADQRQELASQMREQLETGKQKILQDWAEQGMTPASGFRPGGTAVSKRDARAQRLIAKAKRRMPDAEFQAENQGLFSGMAMGAEFDEEPFADSMRAFMYRIWKAEPAAKDSGNGDLVAAIRADKEKLFKALSRPQNAGLSERLPAEGGFLVPEILRSQILMLALEQSVVRPRAQVIPMDSLRVPMPIIDDTSHVSNVYGGVAAYWTAEGATLAATAPAFGRFELEARKLTAYTTIPNELLQDSITPLDRWFDIFFPKAMAYFEDVAFISGTGAGEPQGFLNAPAAIKLNSGNGDGVNYKLMGRPLIVSEKIPSALSGNTTTAGALSFVDLSQYLLGDRQSMQIATSEEYLFASDLVAYRVIERLDGRVWQQTALTPQNGSAQTLSPVVLLDTPHA